LTDPEGASTRLLALLEEARPVFEQADDHLGMHEVWRATASVEYAHGQVGASIAALERAAERSRQVGDIRLERSLLGEVAAAHFAGPTTAQRALAWLDGQTTEIAQRRPGLSVTRAFLEAMLGNFDESRVLLADVFERTGELGLPSSLASEASWFVETLAGDHAAAERAMRHECELLEQLGDTARRSTLACYLARSLYVLGRYDEAEEWIAVGERLSASDDIINQVLVRQVRGKLLARRGEHRVGEHLAREAVAIVERTDILNDHGDALVDLAEVLELTGKPNEAADSYRQALALYTRKGNLVSAGQVTRLIADQVSLH
jgi:tetratricopeptide (TPR) repeat protein